MGKYRRYKNRVEMFLSSAMGKRVLNFCYSWGASIVILGAMFKILHIAYANQILFVAMLVESLVFFISAFEKPNKDYNWEDVFPVLKSKNPLDRPDFSKQAISTLMTADASILDESPAPVQGQVNVGGAAIGGQPINLASVGITSPIDVTEEDTKNLSESIKKLSGAAEQISKMAELTDATQKYLDQLSHMSDNMERFGEVTNSLTNVSDTLLNSYKSITDNSDEITQNSQGYVQQMEMLNRNLNSLNSIYELQLRSISTQMESIGQINAGMGRIREMYDGSVMDSAVFRAETQKMAQQLTQLNQVYGRLLEAMTVNMHAGMTGVYQQPPQQQPVYQQPPQGNPYQAPYTPQSPR